MTLIVNNESGVNTILSVEGKEYLIRADDHAVALQLTGESTVLSVKREKTLSAPPYKKVLSTEFLGILSLLFIKPWFYVLDVSATHAFNTNGECATVRIVRTERQAESDIDTYDVIMLESTDLTLKKTVYHVKKRSEISSVYDKSKRVGHFWLYVVLEFFFTLIGILITYPLLLAIYFTTKAAVIVALMILVPLLSIGMIALIGILPLHFFFRHERNSFYRSMESEAISRCLKNDDHYR